MRIAVFGAGAVGAYFGGRLAQAGESVAFIARGTHLEALQRNGLHVESVAGDFTIQPIEATDDPRAPGCVDVVLVGVKAWQVPEAARGLAPLLGARTFVVPLQNGVEAPDQLATAVGPERVLTGLCRIAGFISGPGRIRHSALAPRIEFGERDNRASERVQRLHAAFARTTGVTAVVPADGDAALWDKFLFIAPVSAVGAVTRMPIGAMRAVPETRRLLEAAMRELTAVARSRGVALPADAVEQTLAMVDRLPADATTSMQRDVLDGKPSELEQQVGAVLRLGSESGVPVPVSEFLYAGLLPAERKARGALGWA